MAYITWIDPDGVRVAAELSFWVNEFSGVMEYSGGCQLAPKCSWPKLPPGYLEQMNRSLRYFTLNPSLDTTS